MEQVETFGRFARAARHGLTPCVLHRPARLATKYTANFNRFIEVRPLIEPGVRAVRVLETSKVKRSLVHSYFATSTGKVASGKFKLFI